MRLSCDSEFAGCGVVVIGVGENANEVDEENEVREDDNVKDFDDVDEDKDLVMTFGMKSRKDSE